MALRHRREATSNEFSQYVPLDRLGLVMLERNYQIKLDGACPVDLDTAYIDPTMKETNKSARRANFREAADELESSNSHQSDHGDVDEDREKGEMA